MNSIKYEQQLIQAIQTIVDNSIEKANFDKTVKATIIKCLDPAIGKYQIKYQDNYIVAFSNNINLTYAEGTCVYVLFPGNDTSQNKSILGIVDETGSNYISAVENEDVYEYYGKNCINSNLTFGLNTYQADQVIDLYDFDNDINLINFNPTEATTYITKSSYLICGATFQTKLAQEQKFQGNYGIGFDLVFKDKNNIEVIRKYLMDINRMTGSPYSFTNPSEQKNAFVIDGANFIKVKKIYIFQYGFLHKDEEKLNNDIFISNIQLLGANGLSEEELKGNSLVLKTPQGIYFDSNDLPTATRTLQAIVKINGKIANSGTLKYYWFKENNTIDVSSEKYNQYGGLGWECLNDYNIIQEEDPIEEIPKLVQWNPGNSEFIITKTDIAAKEMLYKCVVIYNNVNTISKEIKIYNNSSSYTIEIFSSNGTEFYEDTGSTTLTCKINGEEETGSDYSYKWSVVDSNGVYTKLETPEEDTLEYNNAVENRNILLEGISNGTIIQEEVQNELNNYNSIIYNYEYSMLVTGNKIYNLEANTILFYSIYKCSVYYQNNYIGSNTITLTNTEKMAEIEVPDYNLVINNGNQVFQYNENGISPCSNANINPQIISPLSFTLYNKQGTIIDPAAVSSKVEWIVPSINTLIKTDIAGEPSETTATTKIYRNLTVLPFEIENIYNANKNNNDIELKIVYDENIIVAKTTLTFVKQGENGTNGTDIICKIVPNVASGISPKLPIVTYDGTTYNWNYNPATVNKYFKVELWENGNKIFTGTQTGARTDSPSIPVTVEWEILKNKYTSSVNDFSNFTIAAQSGEVVVNTGEPTINTSHPANLVRCKVVMSGDTYYAIIPIIFIRLTSSAYKINFKEDSGFNFAMYSTDGTKPSYDSSTPFELTIMDVNTETDISLDTLTTFTWTIKGRVYSNNQWIDSINIITRNYLDSTIQKNQKYFAPNTIYNGLCLSNGVECKIKYNNSDIGTIHIPIYLYLNRYGYAALNGWNGNSISVNNNDGLILTPQIGTGKKENDNSFTGLFMGSVKKSSASATENGLFGYKNGERTIELNADDGSAKFGKAGTGQIIIDPSSGAKIRGGNYSTSQHTGMEIDLSTPTIKYGSGKFEVAADGTLTCSGAVIGGQVAATTGSTFNGTVTATSGSTFNGTITANAGSSFNGSITAGSTINNTAITNGSLFAVDAAGNLTCRNANIYGNIYMPAGGQIVGSQGVLTNLTYKSDALCLLGFNIIQNEGTQFSKSDLRVDVIIPENFEVQKANMTITLYKTNNFIQWTDDNWEQQQDTLENCKVQNIRLYKLEQTGYTFTYAWFYGFFPEGEGSSSQVSSSSIPFKRGTTTIGATYTNTTSTGEDQITIGDFSSFLKSNGVTVPGKHSFILRTTNTTPVIPEEEWEPSESQQRFAFGQSQFAFAEINLMGWTKSISN